MAISSGRILTPKKKEAQEGQIEPAGASQINGGVAVCAPGSRSNRTISNAFVCGAALAFSGFDGARRQRTFEVLLANGPRGSGIASATFVDALSSLARAAVRGHGMSDFVQADLAQNPAPRPRKNRLTAWPEPITTTINGASAVTGLSRRTVQELAANGTLRSVFLCGRRLVFLDSIRDFLNAGSAD